MVISKNSQLGLRFNEPLIQKDFLICLRKTITTEMELLQKIQKKFEDSLLHKDEDGTCHIRLNDDEAEYYQQADLIENTGDYFKLKGEIHGKIDDQDLRENKNSSYYFICESVYKCAELIKIKENFTGRSLKDIKYGKYTYLLGKNKMCRFIVALNVIKGVYYDSEKNRAFEWGIEMETGNFFFSYGYNAEFTELMKVLTFVELGDIEIKEIKDGQNNGKTKKDGKITNTSQNTVYVVDSTWNTIVIRTEGFAVRGHFRLQPYGHNMADRKLIWIDAFEKHGYKRRPRAEIIQ